MQSKVKSTILLFLTAMIWGLAFVAQKEGSLLVGTFTFNGVRFALGAISIIPVILIFEKETFDKIKVKNTVIAGIIAGIILFIASSLQQAGIYITQSAGKAGFITGLYIVLVPIIGSIFYKYKTSILMWIGTVFAVIGLYLLSACGGSAFGTGDIVLLAGAVFWALHIIVIDNYVSKISPIKFAFIQFFICAVLCLICAVLFEDMSFDGIISAKRPILYSGIMSVGVAYTCQILGQREADPTFAAIVFSAESVFGALGGALLLGEKMNTEGYIGCFLIFIGIVLSQLDPAKIFKKRKEDKCGQKSLTENTNGI